MIRFASVTADRFVASNVTAINESADIECYIFHVFECSLHRINLVLTGLSEFETAIVEDARSAL